LRTPNRGAPPCLLRIVLLSPSTSAQSGRGVATRRVHRPHTGGGEIQAPKARRNVVLLRLRRPIHADPNGFLRFAALATNPSEISGIGDEEMP
jgi:hypothetical protein